MMGVRKDGTAFGILFDTTWKAELSSTDEKIELRSEGELFVYLSLTENHRRLLFEDYPN